MYSLVRPEAWTAILSVRARGVGAAVVVVVVATGAVDVVVVADGTGVEGGADGGGGIGAGCADGGSDAGGAIVSRSSVVGAGSESPEHAVTPTARARSALRNRWDIGR